ncbi:MAG TPA: hypothetical protein VG406_09230 [Isosphaeraceae bacterium]|jgi:hypothetical protein|nr:hypothetical protein [Isosphaeraceae bacterium]
MTRLKSLAVLGLLGVLLATSTAEAGWGRRRGRATAHRHQTTRDDRVNSFTPYRFDHEGYQGYNLGAFDIPEVRARRGEVTPSGFTVLRFPLPWRRSYP